MREFVLPFLVYVAISPLVSLFFDSIYLSYSIKILLTGIFIIAYRKHYTVKPKYDLLTIVTGIAIFLAWIGLEGKYPMPAPTVFAASGIFAVLIKLMGSILIAPLVEEFFVRGFLMRYLISKRWRDVPIGKYTFFSFIITTLFFGLSHHRWLPGIISGVLLNILLYKKRDISSCVVAHATANLLLAAYVLSTQNWIW